MRILVIYRHFWPDSPPYASMLRSIATELVSAGHEVTIWCEQPCYKMADGGLSLPKREVLDGIRIERIGKLPGWRASSSIRLLDKLFFIPRILAKAFWRRLRGLEYDIVWTATIPPVIQGWAGYNIARLFKARFLYHCQDLYPELAEHMKIWKSNGLLSRMMTAIEKRTRARADLLVTLSDDMSRTVRALASPRKMVVINNFMLDDFSDQQQDGFSECPSAQHNSCIRLIFAGNLGAFQGLEQLVKAMRLVELDAPNLELVLLGEGTALPALKVEAKGLGNVHFEGHRPFAEAQLIIAEADIGVVSLEPELYRFAFPSKTLTYLGLALPIFAIVEPESQLAEMITSQGVGFIARDRDAWSIADALLQLSKQQEELPSLRDKALSVYHRDHARRAVLQKWVKTIDDLRPSL